MPVRVRHTGKNSLSLLVRRNMTWISRYIHLKYAMEGCCMLYFIIVGSRWILMWISSCSILMLHSRLVIGLDIQYLAKCLNFQVLRFNNWRRNQVNTLQPITLMQPSSHLISSWLSRKHWDQVNSSNIVLYLNRKSSSNCPNSSLLKHPNSQLIIQVCCNISWTMSMNRTLSKPIVLQNSASLLLILSLLPSTWHSLKSMIRRYCIRVLPLSLWGV